MGVTPGARASQRQRGGNGAAVGKVWSEYQETQRDEKYFSDNLRYGVSFAKKFIDGPDKKQLKKTGELRNLMNLHNNKAGRMVSRVQIQSDLILSGPDRWPL